MKKFIWSVLALIFLFSTNCYATESYKIGVLSRNNPVKATKMWQATGDYLTSKINGKNFEIVPLGFKEINPAIEQKKIDFILFNGSAYITAKAKYGVTAVATMVNSRQNKPLKSFGGVIIASAENEKINSLQDLKGKIFMGVVKSSFGGFQMALKEMMEAGIDPFKDFAQVEFGGKHDNVVLAVQNGVVDAGTVRTDTLERMATKGIIDMEEFKIINRKDHVGFPFVCSTKLYPEWPLAKLKDTPEDVVKAVVTTLKQLKPEEKAAKNAKIIGWVDPLDYSPVDELQKSLKVGAYAAN